MSSSLFNNEMFKKSFRLYQIIVCAFVSGFQISDTARRSRRWKRDARFATARQGCQQRSLESCQSTSSFVLFTKKKKQSTNENKKKTNSTRVLLRTLHDCFNCRSEKKRSTVPTIQFYVKTCPPLWFEWRNRRNS